MTNYEYKKKARFCYSQIDITLNTTAKIIWRVITYTLQIKLIEVIILSSFTWIKKKTFSSITWEHYKWNNRYSNISNCLIKESVEWYCIPITMDSKKEECCKTRGVAIYIHTLFLNKATHNIINQVLICF